MTNYQTILLSYSEVDFELLSDSFFEFCVLRRVSTSLRM
jgi:hypothetical protein